MTKKELGWSVGDDDDMNFLFEGMMASGFALEPRGDPQFKSSKDRQAFEKMEEARVKLLEALAKAA